MPQTKREIEGLLAGIGHRPRHRFGQNFMVEPDLVRRIADAGEVAAGERVIEVGPGTGTLTQELLERGADVLAVELDRDLAAALRAKAWERLELVEGDALASKHALHPTVEEAAASGAKLVANLPYNIASPLVVELLLAGCPLLAFTVQKEVAQRLRATTALAGEYGPLSVIVQTLAEVEVLRTIPPSAFWPRPSIDSSLVRLRCRPELAVEDPQAFSRFVALGFGQRRKVLRTPLAAAVGSDQLDTVLAAAGLDGSERAEQVDVEAWQQMFRIAVDPS